MSDLKIFTENIEPEAVNQIYTLIKQPAFSDCKVRIMPDVHSGAGCVIGFTADLGNKVIPNIVGVDIGCLDKDSEILTPKGWVKISEYDNQDILVFNKKKEIAYFEKPYAYIKEDCDEFYHFKNTKGLDQMLSEEHRMLVYKGYKNREYIMEDLRPYELLGKNLEKGYFSFETTFNLSNQKGIDYTDNQIKLDVMIQADGTMRKDNKYELHLKKKRKIDRARYLLETEGISYDEYLNSDKTTSIIFYTNLGFNKNLEKYYYATKDQLLVLAEESLLWDGHTGDRSFYSSTDRKSADVIQFAFASNGIRAGISCINSDDKGWSPNYIVTPTKNSKVGYTGECKKIKSEDGKKYCFTTSTGYFIARRNGKIFVTGNCGMLTVNLGTDDIDLKYLDNIIRRYIPHGREVHDSRIVRFYELQKLHCYRHLKDSKRIERSIGTLGGGNHFIELDVDSNNNKYLIIHSGSRNLGKQVANYYQNLAVELMQGKDELYVKQQELIAEYKAKGKKKEIQSAIKDLHAKFQPNKLNIPKELCFLTGRYREEYLHDMKICQQYANLNRITIASIIITYLCLISKCIPRNFDMFETVHNYIDHNSNIVRKGAISAKTDELLLIPINMRDGCILGKGKGNEDWNCSAPHGAGRIMSRSKAKTLVDMEEYRDSMKGIYTTSVNESTLDEAPMVYKPLDEIVNNIKDTVEIIDILKPIYNFKSCE